MKVRQPTVQVCPGLRGFSGCRTFSVETRRVLGKPEWLVTLPEVVWDSEGLFISLGMTEVLSQSAVLRSVDFTNALGLQQ